MKAVTKPIWPAWLRMSIVLLTVGIFSSLSLLGGIGIEAVGDHLVRMVPLLIALPAMNSAVGDYATIIAAHAGNPKERNRSKKELVKAIATASIVTIVFVGASSLLLAWQRDYHLTVLVAIKFVAFITVAMAAVISLMFFITYGLDKLLERSELNPDDILLPVVTTISDVFMLGLIAAAALWLF